MLSHIENCRANLRKSEEKVADWILAHPNETVELSIGALATTVGVSEPTIIRFCRALNYDGYHSFKQKLQESLNAGVPYVHGNISDSDSTINIIDKVIDQASAALLKTKQSLDPKAIDKAMKALLSASQVLCVGHGASGVVARDIQQKLLRVGIPVSAYTDHHVHSLAATLLTKKDVLIAISHTGRSQDIIDSANFARENNSTVISFTQKDTPLAAVSNIVLESGTLEDTTEFIPMISRLADLAIVDVLLVCLALKRGTSFIEAMERSKKIIESKRTK